MNDENKWTAEEIINLFDSDLNITIQKLALRSGWTRKELKELLLKEN